MQKTMRFVFILLFSFVTAAVFAQVTVSGVVSDADTKAPLSGASVIEKNTNNGIITDAKGMYTLKVKSSSSILIFSYAGKTVEQIAAGSSGTVDIFLADDNSSLSDVVVTASRQPARKLETTTSVEVISSKALRISKPEGVAEAIAFVPGIYVNASQGRRAAIVTRGFPEGNPLGGLDYTTMLIDGLPILATTGRLPESSFGFDLNVDKVEVVRGSAATLFGRSAAAGAINMITKVGGEKIGGTVRFTTYNNLFKSAGKSFNNRIDFNINGAVTKNKKLRFNFGGWTLKDNGTRQTSLDDKGYQIRGNLDYIFANNKGKIQASFMRNDYVFQNLTDMPADVNTMTTGGSWSPTSSIQNWDPFYNIRFTVYETNFPAPVARRVLTPGGDSISINIGNSLRDKGNYNTNNQFGLSGSFNLGRGFVIEDRFRTQRISAATKYSFGATNFFQNTNQFRLYFDGESDNKDVMNEIRLKKSFTRAKSTHNFTLGTYFSRIKLIPITYSFAHFLNVARPDSIKFAVPLAAFPRGAITRNGDYVEKASSIFFGDEMKFNNRLTINAGIRYDVLNIDMKENKKPYDSTITRNAKLSDWSASIGVNYLLNNKSAIYGNLTRAFKAPDYASYTSLEFVSFANRTLLRLPNGLSNNEIITNYELGIRSGFGDASIDAAFFHTLIKNRVASIFENGLLVSKPLGSNKISGLEISATFSPSSIKGLSIRTNFTFQNAQFKEFSLPISSGGIIGNAAGVINVDTLSSANLYGNKLVNKGAGKWEVDLAGKHLTGVPKTIWNTMIVYTHKYFGIDFSANVNGKRYVDPTEILQYPTLVNLNSGVYVRLPIKGKQEIRLGVQAKNLTNKTDLQNVTGLGASEVVLGQKQKTPNFVTSAGVPIWASGYTQSPRRWLIYLSFGF
jgi:iron complex outermembrane recepter protein